MRKSASGLPRTRDWWAHRQGLSSATTPKTIEACVHRTGWLVTSGSPAVYLTVRARMPGTSRDAVDRAALDGTPLIEVPGPHARPPMLVPRDEIALALRWALLSYDRHLEHYLRTQKIDEADLRSLGSAVCRALEEGPLPSADIRRAVMRTHATKIDLFVGALVSLTLRGVVRRFPADGRLDSAKYRYDLLHPDDRPNLDEAGDDETVARHVTGRYLRWHGPVTLDQLVTWTQLTKGATRRAFEALGAEPVALDGAGGEGWLMPDEARRWKTFAADRADRVVLLPYRDPFVRARVAPAELSDDAAAVVHEKGKTIRLSQAAKLSHHAIVSGSVLVGVWDYDPRGRAVVTRLWNGERGLARRVADAADAMTHFVREQLGDLKLASVDPPAARARRLAFFKQK
jgi:hypothetical protein